MAKVGGGGPNLVEPGQPTISSLIRVSWVKEKLDLAELARLRWIELWTIKRLADHFGISATAIKDRLRAIKKNPSRGGFASRPSNIRGR
ncbi:MAG: hypothetical protein ACXWRE_16665 [Pseudobdellovibrionaceae bacterium]